MILRKYNKLTDENVLNIHKQLTNFNVLTEDETYIFDDNGFIGYVVLKFYHLSKVGIEFFYCPTNAEKLFLLLEDMMKRWGISKIKLVIGGDEADDGLDKNGDKYIFIQRINFWFSCGFKLYDVKKYKKQYKYQSKSWNDDKGKGCKKDKKCKNMLLKLEKYINCEKLVKKECLYK